MSNPETGQSWKSEFLRFNLLKLDCTSAPWSRKIQSPFLEILFRTCQQTWRTNCKTCQKCKFSIELNRDHQDRLRDHPSLVQTWESECWGVLGLTPEGSPVCFIDTRREPYGPIDTSRGPYVLYWHQKGALCALLGPLCFIDTPRVPCVLYWHQKGGPMCFSIAYFLIDMEFISKILKIFNGDLHHFPAPIFTSFDEKEVRTRN